MDVSGLFNVELSPLDAHANATDGNTLGRMGIKKTFHGALSAHSTGEMLSATTQTKGSAGYVAIEQVTGTLEGKRGSFVLQHFGIMANGENRLILEVVPDSASGELEGLRGKMQIRIENGKHYYDFQYELDNT